MRKTNVIIGILVFLLVASIPMLMNIGKSSAAEAPEVSLNTPEILAMGDNAKCIYDTEYMRHHHMEILADWKVHVVRYNQDVFVSKDGKKYEMSLQNTCLKCHSNYDEFCKKCHDYNGVEPNCWNCHVNPSTAIGGAK